MVNILVVEDEAITAMDIKSRLEGLGYIVSAIANSGEEAISLVEKFNPDIVLMDIVLKGTMDGTAAAKHISSHNKTPVVFLTAYSDEDTFSRAILSAPYGYITKPFETRDLRIGIELALFKRSADIKISAAEERYHLVMEKSTCGIFIVNEYGIVSELNKQAELIIGRTRENVIGKNFINFIAPAEQDYAVVQIQKLLLEKNTIGPNEGHIQQPNGNLRDVEFTAVYVEGYNEKFMFSILTDITERNRLRAQTLLADKLATVGTLAAGIIHEINNPMSWIALNLNYLKDKLPLLQVSDPEQQQLQLKLTGVINDCIQGADKIKSIVHDLKGFARIDQDEIKPIDVHELLKTAINIAYPHYKNFAKLEMDFSPDIPLLLGNAKLQQVFLNLIINSAQALDQNNFKNNIIRVVTSLDENRIRIDIADTGKGIPPHVLPKIFDPFFTTKPVGIGTGLGLSICYDIIHNLGGEISVESVLEKGTTFSIYLPVQLKVESPDEPVLPPATELLRKKILVVDDNPTLLIVIRRILEKHHDVTVSDGRAALELLIKQGDKFDVIITDLNMPDVNGIDLYRYVSKNYGGLENRMIFTTGGCYTSLMSEFIKSVKNPCLEKPFTSKQLQEAINKIFVST